MSKMALESLGIKLKKARGEIGIRKFAEKIGTSPATLSRVERGHMPDIATLRKICLALEIDPAEIIGGGKSSSGEPKKAVHFRKDAAIKPETAEALAQLILAAQRALMASGGDKEDG